MTPPVVAKSACRLLSTVEIRVNRRPGREFVPTGDILLIEMSRRWAST